jgi:hypothetical protein
VDGRWPVVFALRRMRNFNKMGDWCRIRYMEPVFVGTVPWASWGTPFSERREEIADKECSNNQVLLKE